MCDTNIFIIHFILSIKLTTHVNVMPITSLENMVTSCLIRYMNIINPYLL